MIKAINKGNLKEVKVLIKKGANINTQYDGNTTALILASEEGHTEIVKLLIKNGADINLQNEGGSTAFDGGFRDGDIQRY